MERLRFALMGALARLFGVVLTVPESFAAPSAGAALPADFLPDVLHYKPL